MTDSFFAPAPLVGYVNIVPDVWLDLVESHGHY